MKKILTLCAIFIFILSNIFFAQTTRNVPGDYATIQAAITAAIDGDVIHIAAGAYDNGLTTLTVDKSLTFTGEGPASNPTTIITSTATRIITLSATGKSFSFQNLIVEGNTSNNGIYAGSSIDIASLSMQDVVLRNCQVGLYLAENYPGGGPLTTTVSSLNFDNVTLTNNKFIGAYIGKTVLSGTVTNSTITGNGYSSDLQVAWQKVGLQFVNFDEASVPHVEITNCYFYNNGAGASDIERTGLSMYTAYNALSANELMTVSGSSFINHHWAVRIKNEYSVGNTATINGTFSGNDLDIWFNRVTGITSSTTLVRRTTLGIRTVGAGTTYDYNTIQAAIDAADPGDVIEVAAGAYDITSSINVNKSVNITGPASGSPAIVQGTNSAIVPVFVITSSNVTVQNLEITHNALTPGLPSPWVEASNSLVVIPTGVTGLTGITITNNHIHVPVQAGAMSTWNGVALTVVTGTTAGINITNNIVHNTRNGIIVQYNNIASISNNSIYDTKGGIMNYTNTQLDANNRTLSNNTWGSTHNEWDIVWNTAYYVPDYNQSVLALSNSNNGAYVVDRRAADATACANLTGNRSHVFVNSTTGTTTTGPTNGNANLPYATIALGISAVVPGGYVNVAAGTYTENVVVNKTITLSGENASTTVIVATNANSYPLTFSSSGATVSGFTLTHNYTPSELSSWNFNNNGVAFSGASNTGNTLTHCIITLNRNGIYINNSQNNIITENTITDNRTGLNMCGNMNGTVITNNIFSDNWTEGIVTYGNSTLGIDYSTITVTGNTFSNNWYSDILIKDAPAYTGTLDVTDNTFTDSPVTYSLSTNASLNEPAFADLKPVSLGGTAVPPTTVIPTLRIYNSGSVGLSYNSTKTVLVDGGTTIQASINVASAGDIILVNAGSYSENININKSLIVNSVAGAASTTISGSAGTPTVTISANNIIVNGFSISNPGGHYGIYASDRSGIAITNNIINNVGPTNATSSTSNSGIAILCSSSAVSDITIENNNISNIQGGNYTSSNAIAIGWSNGTFDVTNLLIQNNSISNITSATEAWPVGRGAYGILMNHGGGTTGKTVNPQILNNTISNLEGLWAHGIGLEGNTPNAIVNGNTINNLIDHKSPTDPDAVAVMIEDNASANTVAINNNSFKNVWLGVRNATALDVDATLNYWGTIQESKIQAKIYNLAHVDYDPWVGKGVSPANNQTGVSIWTTQITWSAFGSRHYDFMLYKDGTNTGGGTQVGSTQNNLTTLYAAISSPLEYQTEYYWYIKDNSASEWDEFHFTTASSSAAYLISPADGSTNYGTTIYFNWLSYATGVVFDLQIDDDPAFGSPTTIGENLSVFYFAYDGSSLIPGQVYKWRVLTRTSGTVTGTSTIWSFTMPGLPVPTAYYPTGGVVNYSNPPTLYWTSSSYSSSNAYIVRYWKEGQTPPTSTTAQTNLVGYFNTGSANVTASITATLDAGATYNWEVAITNGSSTSNWSSPTASFVVYSSTPIAPPVPYPSWPVGGNTSYINPPTLYWYLGVYATGLQFYIEWDDDSNLDDLPLGYSGWITDYYYTIPTSLPAGTIHWRVRSRIGSSGTPSAWSNTETFVIPSLASSVPVPTVIYPTGGTVVYSLSQYLYWFAYSTSALEFQVNVSQNPGVDGNGELNSGNTFYPGSSTFTSNQYYLLSGLSAGSTYYWQVRTRVAGSPGTESSWSTLASFTTAAGSFAVVPLIGSPNFEQPINSTSAVLTWITPTQSESPLKYEVEISKSKDMTNSVILNCENKPFAELNGLDTKATYYWRVKSKTDNGSTSNYSAVGSFKTEKAITDAEAEIIPAEFSLMQNYPNPFNPTTYITYSIPKNTFVTLKIYDMLGKEVKTLVNEDVNAGKISVIWNGEDNNGNKVASGAYIYRVTAGDFVSAKKMLLIK